MIWGNQQPSWMPGLDSATQYDEIVEWMDTVAARFPNISQVEVVNEALHDPPDDDESGNYIDALGGSGETGFDWIIESFRIARKAFGSDADLMINEYGIMNDPNETDNYKEIIDLLVAEDTLINSIGLQAHCFNHNVTEATVLRNLDTLAATGLDIYITEYDAYGQTDRIHVSDYMKYFPLFWEHEAVKGITLWGFRPGMWQTESKGYLIDASGVERPAMTWLRAYINDEFVANTSITVSTSTGETTIEDDKGTLTVIAEILPEDATLTTVDWSVNNSKLASIDENGVLTAKGNGMVTVTARSLEYQSTVQDQIDITITGQIDGIESISNAGITLFPNPVTEGIISVRGMENIEQISVMTINGSIIAVEDVRNMNDTDISLNVPAGMYIVKFSHTTGSYFSKIIVN
jgi:endo-1,4-beta-xylanase